MAREFTTGEYLQDSFTEISTFPFTVCCWAITNNTSTAQVIMQLGNGTTLADSWALLFRPDVGGDPVQFRAEGDAGVTTADSTTSFSSGTWHHVCGVATSASSRTIYLDGGSSASDTTTNNVSLPTDLNFGSDFAGGNSLNTGSVAEMAFWNVSLTAVEIASLAAGASPQLVRPGSLTRGCRFLRSGNDDLDYMSGGSFTQTGTVDQVSGPATWQPTAQVLYFPPPPPAVGGVTSNLMMMGLGT